MRIVRGLPPSAPDRPPSVVALGAFDGVHLAHQKILDLAIARAQALGASAVACTFDPHPLQVLRPGQAPEPITTLAERLELIGERGIDVTVVIPFTRELSQVEPEAFVADVLVGALRAREIVVGFNHTFGRGARGDAGLLQSLGPRLGFRTHVIPPLEVGGTPVSSSAVREALRAGDVGAARRLLGRPWTVRGVVVRGAGRGRRLGFPTANVRPDRPLLVATGVYAGRARIGLEEAAPQSAEGGHKCVVNVGYRPTFGEDQYWVEAYLIDFSGDLYDRPISLALAERIREERKFPDLDALVKQVQADVETAGGLL
jgi:riboflavin kinase/FMN adenylyltransferase